LRGIISLLSDHLYSTPHVYVRELLQNAVDAIVARRQLDPAHVGSVRIDVEPLGDRPTLRVRDAGIGLTEYEIHQLLATTGQSSNRSGGPAPGDFIGQFGIGLLSCFIVADEIVVRTRSARARDAPVLEWRGRHDGTYGVSIVDDPMPPGTEVVLSS